MRPPGSTRFRKCRCCRTRYSAEYGGLAGVIVSTKRGANRYRATGFYDYNSNELNARTYAQALNNVSRDDPNADTHDYRYGLSFGGPVARNRTFFFANYEGSKLKSLGGGSQAIVPTAAMRNGDFSANTFVVRDPVTGVQFPGNRIPADRIDPSARRILDFFYPLPNQANLAAGGYGAYRADPPAGARSRSRGRARRSRAVGPRFALRARQLAAARSRRLHVREHRRQRRRRPDESRSARPSIEGDHVRRRLDPDLVRRRWSANSAAATAADTRNRKSHFVAGPLGAQLQLEVPPLAAEVPGFPSFLFSGTNRPSDIRDQRQNAFRDLDQSSASFSSSTTWLKGRHSIKFGGIYSRNYAKDGYSTGANESKGAYAFSGFATGNAFADLLLGLPNQVREQRNTRGDLPMDTFSNDWARVRAGRLQADVPAHAVPGAAV